MRGYRYCFVRRADAQVEIEARLLIHFHKKGGHGYHLETVALRGNRVRPGKKIVNPVAAEGIRRRCARVSGLVVACLHHRARHECGFFVAYVAKQAAGRSLSPARDRHDCKNQKTLQRL
jgi:hypothetical protein